MHHQRPTLDHSGPPFSVPIEHLGRGWWITKEQLVFHSADVVEVCVPRFFVCDLASIPWFARWLIDRAGDSVYAAIVHDYLLSRHVTSRLLADAIFREALIASSVPRWKRRLMYIGVRIGAYLPWKNEVPKDILEKADRIIFNPKDPKP